MTLTSTDDFGFVKIQNTEHSKDSPTDDTSDDESLFDEEEVGQARRLRTMNINEWLTDEKVQDIENE